MSTVAPHSRPHVLWSVGVDLLDVIFCLVLNLLTHSQTSCYFRNLNVDHYKRHHF
jgi:hypothetical protein